jgi:glutamine transport system substrate-binding protein
VKVRNIQAMAEQTVRVAIDDASPAPMQIGDPDRGNFRGYEVDLLKEVARRVGFRLSFRRAPWSVIVHELAAGEVDLVCSAATVTSDREREVDFCSPHLDVSLAVVKRAGLAADITLHGLRLGLRRGTTAETYVRQRMRIEPVRISESNEELYALLSAAELDAVVDDLPIAKWFSHQLPGLQFAGVLPGTEGAYAIMVGKKNHKLRREINRALAEIENAGTRRMLLMKWFGNDPAKVN